jgi:hypothetical protein
MKKETKKIKKEPKIIEDCRPVGWFWGRRRKDGKQGVVYPFEPLRAPQSWGRPRAV